MRLLPRTFAARIFVAQAVAVVLGLAAVGVLTVMQIDRLNELRVGEQAQLVAVSLAREGAIRDALDGSGSDAAAQAVLESQFPESGMEFLVVVDTRGMRVAHSDPGKAGRPYSGSWESALDGTPHTVIEAGHRGVSLRALAPVVSPDGHVSGVVVSGVTLTAVDRRAFTEVLLALLTVAAAVLVTLAVIAVISRWARRVTWGAAAGEVEASVGFYSAVVDASADALVVCDSRGRIVRINQTARELLGIAGADPVDRTIASIGLPPHAADLLQHAGPIDDAVLLLGERVLMVSIREVVRDEHFAGRVIRIADHTRWRELLTRLDGAEGMVGVLQEHTHEFRNRLHAIVWQLETGHADEARAFASAELEATRRIGGDAGGGSPLAALLLAKRSAAADRGIDFVADATGLDDLGLAPGDAVSVVGNLLDNAFDAVTARAGDAARRVTLTVRPDSARDGVTVEVADNGAGLPEDAAQVLTRGWTTKREDGHGVGLALVRRIVHERGGSILLTRGEGGAGTIIRLRFPAASAAGAQ